MHFALHQFDTGVLFNVKCLKNGVSSWRMGARLNHIIGLLMNLIVSQFGA